MKFACPHCSQRLEAESTWAGREINCPTCSGIIAVPGENLKSRTPGETPGTKGRRFAVWGLVFGVFLVGLGLGARRYFAPKAWPK